MLENKPCPVLEITGDIESKLDEADCAATLSDTRYSHEEVFKRLKVNLS